MKINYKLHKDLFKSGKLKDIFVIDIAPITASLIRKLKIDEISLNNLDGDLFPPNKHNLFIGLLLASHPKVNLLIEQMRKTIRLEKLLTYSKHDFRTLYNLKHKIFVSIQGVRLDYELKIFFDNSKINIPKDEWEIPIATKILTDFLPIPSRQEPFQIINSPLSIKQIHYQKGSDYNKTPKEGDSEVRIIGRQAREIMNGFPAILITQKVTSVRELSQYVKDNIKEIKNATKNLPKPPVKRTDVDITKLAIGLWIVNNEKKGTQSLEDKINEKYAESEKYFGEYDGLTKTDLPNFKSDALANLNRLFPL